MILYLQNIAVLLDVHESLDIELRFLVCAIDQDSGFLLTGRLVANLDGMTQPIVIMDGQLRPGACAEQINTALRFLISLDLDIHPARVLDLHAVASDADTGGFIGTAVRFCTELKLMAVHVNPAILIHALRSCHQTAYDILESFARGSIRLQLNILLERIVALAIAVFCFAPLLKQILGLPIIIGNLPIKRERSSRLDIALTSIRRIEDHLSCCSRRSRQAFCDHRRAFEMRRSVLSLVIVEFTRKCAQHLLHLLFILRINAAGVFRHHRDCRS